MKMKYFLNKTHLPEKLVRGVIRQLGGWGIFTQSAPDITNYGIAGGFGGFILYTDTVAFAKRHRRDINELWLDLAQSLGEDKYDLLASFNCLKGWEKYEIIEGALNKDADAYTDVQNALAWFAAEEVARNYVDMLEG